MRILFTDSSPCEQPSDVGECLRAMWRPSSIDRGTIYGCVAIISGQVACLPAHTLPPNEWSSAARKLERFVMKGPTKRQSPASAGRVWLVHQGSSTHACAPFDLVTMPQVARGWREACRERRAALQHRRQPSGCCYRL